MSMDTIMEDSDNSVSNTDAIIYGASDISGRTASLISDPNIPNSSSTSEDEYQQQQISTVAIGGSGIDDDLMIIVSSGESSGSTNNNEQREQTIRAFNVDFMGSRSRFHECSICGLEFVTSQALGGHMRRHRAIITSEDEYQQQISTGGNASNGNNSMIIVSSGESSRFTNNKKQGEQKIRIFNVDFMGSRSRPHECSICGLEFITGQLLGGHMRRHRAIVMSENLQVDLPPPLKRSSGPRVLCLDLNLTPWENDLWEGIELLL